MKALCLFCILLISAVFSSAQQPDGKNLPPFSTVIPIPNGIINAGSGNVLLEIPIVNVPQRGGHSMGLTLVYNSKNSRAFGQSMGNKWLVDSGWTIREDFNFGGVLFDATSQWCPNPGITGYRYNNFRLSNRSGVHAFPGISLVSHPCVSGGGSSASQLAADQSNYFLSASVNGSANGDGTVITTVWDQSGNQVGHNNSSSQYKPLRDTNGNLITKNFGVSFSNMDTLGRNPWVVTWAGLFNYIDVPDSSGATVRYTLEYMDINVKTDFQVFSYAECCDQPVRVLKSITLPGNGGQYTFSYDAGTTPGHYGQVTSMTLPTGGQVNFVYTNLEYGTFRSRWVTSLATPEGTTTFSPQCTGGSPPACPTVIYTVNTPVRTEVYTVNNEIKRPTQIVLKDGAVTKAAQTVQYEVVGYAGGFTAHPLSRVTTVYENGSPALWTKTEYTYFTGDLPSSISEWDFYTGTAAVSPKRRTSLTYLPAPSTNMLDRVTSKTVYDEGGAQVSRIEYVYDDYSAPAGLAMTDRGSGIVSHDDAYGMALTARGNLSRERQWVRDPQNPAGDHWVETKHAYDTLGNRVKTIDPLGHITLYDYTDRWASAGCVAANTFAYVTEVKNHLNHRNQTQYFPCTGLAQATRDENDILASRWGEIFTYDSLGRLRSTAFADGGQTVADYDDTQHWIRTKQLRSTGAYIVKLFPA